MLSAVYTGDLKLPAAIKLLLFVPAYSSGNGERRKKKPLYPVAETLAIFLISIALMINCWLY